MRESDGGRRGLDMKYEWIYDIKYKIFFKLVTYKK